MTAGEDDKVLSTKDVWWDNQPADNDNPNKVDHIIVVKKTPVFKTNPFGLDELTYETDKDGNVTYYVDGRVIDKNRVSGNDKDGYKVTYSGWHVSYTREFKLSGFVNKGDIYFSEAEFNAGSDKYHQDRSELTSAETHLSEANSTVVSL